MAMPQIAGAQVSGVVADTVLNRRVPGAVVTLLDASRRPVARALADDSGRFRIENAAALRVRIVKIGYRPTELPVSPPMSLRIALERLPSLLEPIRTSDQPRCRRNATRPAAFGLWEQARAALLGTVLARETNTAVVHRIDFRRYMSARGDEIVAQSVHRDSSLALRSFEASYPASVFMTSGFAEVDRDGTLLFYGPDAEVLLDDALVEHYCLELAAPRRERRTQVGLRFRPMGRERGRVDVDGTLWIDTVSRALRDIEYGYLGLAGWASQWHPGGAIHFAETSPATVWIDRWQIRVTGAGIDSGQSGLIRWRQAKVEEGGGELASARWPDGREWKASLGRAEVRLVTSGEAPLAGARMQLDSTDYGGVTDSTGRLIIDGLLPGPYRISVFDSTLAVVDTALPASKGFTADRGRTVTVTAAVPSLHEFVKLACVDQDVYAERSPMFIARVVVGMDSLPAVRAKWRLEVPAGEHDPNVPAGFYSDGGETGTDGMVYFCTGLPRERRVVLRVWSPTGANGKEGTTVEVTLRDRVTSVKLGIPR